MGENRSEVVERGSKKKKRKLEKEKKEELLIGKHSSGAN